MAVERNIAAQVVRFEISGCGETSQVENVNSLPIMFVLDTGSSATTDLHQLQHTGALGL